MVEGKRRESTNVEKKETRRCRDYAGWITGANRDQNEAEHVPLRRGFLAVQKHFAKEAVLEVLHKPEKSGNKKAVQKRILQKFRLLQSVTFAVLTGAKRAFLGLLPAKLSLENSVSTEAKI